MGKRKVISSKLKSKKIKKSKNNTAKEDNHVSDEISSDILLSNEETSETETEDCSKLESSVIKSDEENKDDVKCDDTKLDILSTDTKELVRYFTAKEKSNNYGILLLKQNQKVAFNGYCQISVLCGNVEIFGYKVKGNLNIGECNFIDAFSPTTSSLLYVHDESAQKLSVKEVTALKKCVTNLFSDEADIFEEISTSKEIFSGVVFRKMDIPLPAILKMLNNHDAFGKDFKVTADLDTGDVYDTASWKDVTKLIACSRVKQETVCHCSVMLCGGKDVGKSSLAKFVINDYLSRYGSVMYLECDCGQTEFSPAAVLSLVKITKPVLGPAFTHIIKPEKAFFYGRISPKDDPSEYIKLIQLLFDHYQNNFSSEFPLVINQQGWVKGLGLSLLVDILRIVSPCYAIQMQSQEFESRNLSEDLSSAIEYEKGWSTDQHYESEAKVHATNYLKLVSKSKKSHGSGKSYISRNLAISSYFADCFTPNDRALSPTYKDWIPPSLSSIKPLKIKWSDVAIHVIHQKVDRKVMLSCLNMALVCLANVDPDNIENVEEFNGAPMFLQNHPIATYLGFGIIRNIDIEKQLFYVVTPVKVDNLQNVNALIKGDLQLPNLYYTQDLRSNHPYYCYDYINVSSKIGAKSKPRFNLKRKPSRMKHSMEVK